MALSNDDLQAIATLVQGVVKTEIEPLKKDIAGIKLHLENVTDRNIALLAENHSNLIDKLNESIKVADKKYIEEIRVNILSDKVDKLEKEIDELKNKIA